jgi:hypothetical protein
VREHGTAVWPALPLSEWQDTYATLHRWTQIVGKVRLSQTPWVNHSWHVTLYPSATGLTTSLIPRPDRGFEIEFDFVAHRLRIRCTDGSTGGFPLEPQSVATFYSRLMAELARLGLPVRIHGRPNELPDTIPFAEDEAHRSYDPEFAGRFGRVLTQVARVLGEFRSRFRGKCSPVQYFWGGADVAVTRFSGRPAPVHPGGIPHLPDWVTREAYSQEVSSCGFWPGSDPISYAAFYAYSYPEPPGFREATVLPDGAYYSTQLGEFILPYDVVREAASPDDTLLAFLQSSYEAAADLAGWNRAALERDSATVMSQVPHG